MVIRFSAVVVVVLSVAIMVICWSIGTEFVGVRSHHTFTDTPTSNFLEQQDSTCQSVRVGIHEQVSPNLFQKKSEATSRGYP